VLDSELESWCGRNFQKLGHLYAQLRAQPCEVPVEVGTNHRKLYFAFWPQAGAQICRLQVESVNSLPKKCTSQDACRRFLPISARTWPPVDHFSPTMASALTVEERMHSVVRGNGASGFDVDKTCLMRLSAGIKRACVRLCDVSLEFAPQTCMRHDE